MDSKPCLCQRTGGTPPAESSCLCCCGRRVAWIRWGRECGRGFGQCRPRYVWLGLCELSNRCTYRFGAGKHRHHTFRGGSCSGSNDQGLVKGNAAGLDGSTLSIRPPCSFQTAPVPGPCFDMPPSPHITQHPNPYMALSTSLFTTNQSARLSANSYTSSALKMP